MKIAFIMFAALTIGALLTISAFQLLKVVIQEMVNMTTEAWQSPEQH
jgi:type II secretory pathway component PulJ